MAGAFPVAAELRRLRERHPALLAHEPELAQGVGDGAEISYTQWEAYLAFEYRIGRLVYLAQEESPRSHLFTVDALQQQSQRRHRERLQVAGEHYGFFQDQRELARRVVYDIERLGLRRNAPPLRSEVLQNARETAAALALEIGTHLRQSAKPSSAEFDPAGIEILLRAVDSVSLKRELDRRTAMTVLYEHHQEVRTAVDEDPTPENLHDLAFAELAMGHYRPAIDVALRLATEQMALSQSEPEQFEEHRREALNAYLLAFKAAELGGRRGEALDILKQGCALIDQVAEPILWADMHEALAEAHLDAGQFGDAESIISEIIDIREEHQENDPALPTSLLLWCRLLYALAKNEGVLGVAARAERLFDSFDPPSSQGISSALTAQGLALSQLSRYSEAEPLMRRALAIDEQAYGPEHTKVATDLNNMAQLLQSTNRLSEAEPMMRRALAIDEQAYGPEHPEVATGLNNLAYLLQDTNRLSEAEPLMRRALAIDEKAYGTEHPTVATDLHNLAQLLQSTNRLTEAEPLMWRALAIDELAYGPEHPTVARDLNNLAYMLQGTNCPSEAEAMLHRALAIDEQAYGTEHPRVARDLNNLAHLLKDTNRLAEAEPLMRRALAIDEKSYGAEHPTVSTRLSNLALLLQSTSRLTEAEPLIRRALAINEQAYGAEHPNVATDLNNLALLLHAKDRFSEAIPLMDRSVAIYRQFTRQTGHEHPDWKQVLLNCREMRRAAGLPEPEE
jgi:tetratricopeptide (TPR) repeat protein